MDASAERPSQITVRTTRLALALADRLNSLGPPVITDYALFLELRSLYQSGRKLYVRSRWPTKAEHQRTRMMLYKEQIIGPDNDYPGVYRILSKQDLPADDIVCLVDPYCYISHLSALQRYGLTDRRPEALHLTAPSSGIIRSLIKEKMRADYGDMLPTLDPQEVKKPTASHHPPQVRRRAVQVLHTIHPGVWVQVRGSFARIGTIGQAFLDTVEEPGRCGGMVHVMEIWRAHAATYLNEIIQAVDDAPKPVHKIRAGYLLTELLKAKDARIENWKFLAQRGSSRVLDPTKPFVNNHSEDWMISLNV